MLEGEVAHQVSRVLRMSVGDEITLLDNSGREYSVQLTMFNKTTVEGSVLSVRETQTESSLELTLYQGLLKGEKFQWVLQKGTELGVSRFVPLISLRTVIQGQERLERTRYPRWLKIITEAAEQSGRCTLPELKPPISLHEACDQVHGHSTSIMPWEEETTTSLRSVLRHLLTPKSYFSSRPIPSPLTGEGQGEGEFPPPSNSLPPGEGELKVNIFIGPEGGFDEEEVDYARSQRIVPVSLGRRILRSETAALATVAAVLYEMGEMER